jgi:hypothetical protein
LFRVAPGPGADSERFGGLGIVTRLDARDNPRYTTRGHFLEARGATYVVEAEEAGTFGCLELDLRGFATVANRITLAARGYALTSADDIPLSRMAELGGLFLLRGYPTGRFLGANALTAQAEVRVPLFWRPRWVLFGAAGTAAEEFGDLLGGPARLSAGTGRRVAINETRDVNIRLDLGFSPEGRGLYVTLMEAF